VFNARTPAHRRYVRRVFVAMLGYLVTFASADYLLSRDLVNGAAAWVLAVVPALCVASVFWALGRLVIEETDEYQRMLLVRQLLVATGLTMVAVTIWGFLSDFDMVAPARGFYPVWIFFFSLGIGALVNKLTVGDSGGC
jgi:hypothetical protein